MALTVGEDTFVSLSEAETYWLNHRDANSTWSNATDPAKEAALREATEFLDTQYNWIGEIESTGQVLSWPRVGTDREGRYISGTPDRIKDATAILALEALSAYLLPAQSRGGKIQAVKAGSVSVQYDSQAPAQKTFDMVQRIIRPLIRGGSINRKVIR